MRVTAAAPIQLREVNVLQSSRILLALMLVLPLPLPAQEAHDHPAPEKLGAVSFPTSCAPAAQPEFNRAVALLHSFVYSIAEKSFQAVADQDPNCAMAHWGIAMTHFHQIWEPPLSPAGIAIAQNEIKRAQQISNRTQRESSFIHALSLVFNDAATVPYSIRARNYENAMRALAAQNPSDVEGQVFYALALIGNASPSDKTHARQKQAAALLEPLYHRFPNHPGIPHYLIHAYDNAELAPRGLAAARAYSKIAPSAPHALHMPSHIFTRLGLWDDSIASNIAARDAAQQQGDIGEQLHAMDYLVYAYLQTARDEQAAQVIQQLHEMANLNSSDFKIGYASVAMPIRYAIERGQWSDAESIAPPSEPALPQVVAIAVWARGLALARNGHAIEARKEAARLQQIEQTLLATGATYWATQVNILKREVQAWSAQAENKPDLAAAILRVAANQEDAIEKLPVTPGPILPAREQLGTLLLAQNHPLPASVEFKTALANAPGRRGALQGAAQAAQSAKPR
jgi:hypothetical protein